MEIDDITGQIVDANQVLTYLRLLNLPVGPLLNFGATTMNEGMHRIVNNYTPSPSATSRLRVNQSEVTNRQ